MRALLALSLAAVAPVCVACGGGGSRATPMDLMTKYEAASAAQKAMSREVGDPASPVYGRQLSVGELRRGSRPGEAGEAWIVTFDTLAGKPSGFCLWIWTDSYRPTSASYTYSVDRCAGAT